MGAKYSCFADAKKKKAKIIKQTEEIKRDSHPTSENPNTGNIESATGFHHNPPTTPTRTTTTPSRTTTTPSRTITTPARTTTTSPRTTTLTQIGDGIYISRTGNFATFSDGGDSSHYAGGGGFDRGGQRAHYQYFAKSNPHQVT
ncbi:2138_t:CDS:1, partial [Cetraspora pellucida]